MGLFSKISSKTEAKVLHRDGSHAYPKELPPKDERPHIDPSAPTPSPAEDIHAEDFAHRQDFRRSQSARRSDLRHELPIPDESEARIGGQQRYYAREQQQRRRGKSTWTEQRPDQLHEFAEPDHRASTEAERAAQTTQTSHRQEPDDYNSVDNLVDPGQHSHHLCFHGPQDAQTKAGVERQDETAPDLSMHDIRRTTGVVMGARTARERDHGPVKIGAANIKHVHRKKSDRERKEGEVRSERDNVDNVDQERSATEGGNQVVQASDLEHDHAQRPYDSGEMSTGAMTGHPVKVSPQQDDQMDLGQHYLGARRDLEKMAVAGI
ncbi:hypothetical protein HII31_02819 [Pseudocercospora fuligena]|uniref:Uncharacterized protein n=1 Tax=Pseudocercospora fuligena TaxID=685502 RepID=A0A8H6RS17_9PEZI|nr:hypothetical protein HII31_02819 [Pseudocercospora fuligena]